MENKVSSLHALVVDDDPSVLDFVGLLLNSIGLRDIKTCECATEALTLIQSNQFSPDVVLCDLQMPSMDGIEFLRHLADTGFKGGVGVISGADSRVISAVERLAKTHNLNFLGYLEKHHLDVSLLTTLLQGVKHPRKSKSKLKVDGFEEWEIRQAINADELVVYYQPKVQTSSGKITGVEALVRWQHPEHGLIKPVQFISVAERYNLIDDLTYAVAERAIDDLGYWHQQGHSVALAINISSKSLYGLDLPERLVRAMESAQVPAHFLTLEVTESQVFEELSAPMEILTRLRLKNFNLSIDDFGTGYASLEQLNRLPFTELKIDQSFVQSVRIDESAQVIIDASISMARRLKMKTVAEGVEDKETFDLLYKLGCDEIQGYFFAKPMPKEDVDERLKEPYFSI